jgi:hypothetical protein
VPVKTIEPTFDEGNENIFQDSPSRHPLVVIATSVKVWPVELRLGKYSLEPSESIDMPDVHPKRDLSLFSISSEMPLAEEQAQYEAFVEGIHRLTFHGKHDGETIPCEVL